MLCFETWNNKTYVIRNRSLEARPLPDPIQQPKIVRGVANALYGASYPKVVEGLNGNENAEDHLTNIFVGACVVRFFIIFFQFYFWVFPRAPSIETAASAVE